jgi:hypothetical protein
MRQNRFITKNAKRTKDCTLFLSPRERPGEGMRHPDAQRHCIIFRASSGEIQSSLLKR